MKTSFNITTDKITEEPVITVKLSRKDADMLVNAMGTYQYSEIDKPTFTEEKANLSEHLLQTFMALSEAFVKDYRKNNRK